MEFLAGLHSKVIHFPIVCFVLYTLFEIAGTVLDKKIFHLLHIFY